jgi:probable rRNA maturation factor
VTIVRVSRTGEWRLPRTLLERGIRELLEAERVQGGEVSVTFLSDTEIRALNRDYLKRDRPTDVIAFALHRPGEDLLGDVYVGFEQARRQADELGIPLREELLRLAIHGVLHVLGYDHPEGTARESSPMYLRQEDLVRRILLPG